MNNRGREGEENAVIALKEAGLQILAQNFRSKEGEIDIIAKDGEKIVFVEVKAWSTFGIENLRYGLDARKRHKIIKTAKFFLSKNRQYNNMSIRFDVIFVENNSVTHLVSAFEEGV